MKKSIKLVMTFIFLTTTGCALVHRKDIPGTATTPQVAETTPAVTEPGTPVPAPEPTAFKKVIMDKDMKKKPR